MAAPINAAAVAALADEAIDWRFKGLPAPWWGSRRRRSVAEGPDVFEGGAVGPGIACCAPRPSRTTSPRWPVGAATAASNSRHTARRTWRSQLFARQLDAGAVRHHRGATLSHVRTYRAFGVRDVVLANELVDEAGLRWLAAELDAHPDFSIVCWVDSVRGVELMTAALTAAGRADRSDVCVEVGIPGGRTGCRAAVRRSTRWRARPPHRLGCGWSVSPGTRRRSATTSRPTRWQPSPATCWRCEAAAVRLAPLFEPERVIVTAGGSTYFDAGRRRAGWRDLAHHRAQRRIPHCTTTGCTRGRRRFALRLRPALQVWAQVVSRPEPGLAVLTMGRRDVSFDQDLPVPARR